MLRISQVLLLLLTCRLDDLESSSSFSTERSEVVIKPLTRRWWLTKYLRRMQREYGEEEYSFHLPFFVLPQETRLFKEEVERQGEFSHWTMRQVKSRRMTSTKVELITDWSQLSPSLLDEDDDIGKRAIIQKILSNPLMTNGKQIHAQLYVALTTVNPLRLYLYQDLVKINLKTPLYKESDDCDSGEPCPGESDEEIHGSMASLQEYFKGKQVDESTIMQKIEETIIKTVLSVERKILKLSQEYSDSPTSFVLCFDLTFDETGNPWLNSVSTKSLGQNDSQLEIMKDWLIVFGVQVPEKVSLTKVEFLIGNYDELNGENVLTNKKRRRDEQEKRWMFAKYFHNRETYLDKILRRLTKEDVQQLTETNDELVRANNTKYKRIFPSSRMNIFIPFLKHSPNLYYFKLFDSWETKFETNRPAGTQLLKETSQLLNKFDDPHRPHEAMPMSSSYNFLKKCSTSKGTAKEKRLEL